MMNFWILKNPVQPATICQNTGQTGQTGRSLPASQTCSILIILDKLLETTLHRLSSSLENLGLCFGLESLSGQNNIDQCVPCKTVVHDSTSKQKMAVVSQVK